MCADGMVTVQICKLVGGTSSSTMNGGSIVFPGNIIGEDLNLDRSTP